MSVKEYVNIHSRNYNLKNLLTFGAEIFLKLKSQSICIFKQLQQQHLAINNQFHSVKILLKNLKNNLNPSEDKKIYKNGC